MLVRPGTGTGLTVRSGTDHAEWLSALFLLVLNGGTPPEASFTTRAYMVKSHGEQLD